MSEDEISRIIIGCAIKLHRELGPGLLESSYVHCLNYELMKAGLVVEREKALPLVYSEVRLDCGYRIDLLVEEKVILEIKAVEALNAVHTAQVITYLKLSGCRLGMLMNFNVALMKDGIKRVVNNL
jgi:GxxExxY protein